jgi:hypothetical protein
MGSGSQRDILVPQRGHLRQAQSGLNGGDQKSMVTPSQPPCSIRRSQQGFDLRASQETHQCTWLPLVGNGQHPLYDLALLWRFQGSIAEEGPDRCQTQVAAPGPIAPLVLQICQKRVDQ